MKTPAIRRNTNSGLYNRRCVTSAICCEQLITTVPGVLEDRDGVDAVIGAGVDKEFHLCEPIRHIQAAGHVAVGCRH